MKRLTTRSIATAQAIANREPFKTSGALFADTYSHGTAGYLSREELDAYHADLIDIDYIVYSYSTPIAWHTPSGWHVVKQKFSPTTSKHQGNLYLVGA